jgi:STE24 endopeptidase
MELINGIPVVSRILWAVLLLSVNFIFSYFEKLHIQKVYKKTFSADEALDRSRILKYLGFFLLFSTIIPVLFLLIPFLRPLGYMGRLVLVVFFVIFIILISLAQQWIMHKTIRQIRESCDTFKEQAGKMTYFLLLIFIPVILYHTIVILMPKSISDSIFSSSILFFLFATVFVLFVKVIILFFYKKTLKVVPLEDMDLLTRLTEFLKTKIKRYNIFIWPTKKSKNANALMIYLFFHYNIFISDYLIENVTVEEMEALLAHELGHERKFHLWVTVFITVLWMPFTMVPANFFNKNETYTPVWFSMSLILIAIFLYFGFLFLFLINIQEKQADRYALEMGIAPATMISALEKLAKLNNMKFNIGKTDDRFNTHSPIKRRIEWLMKEAHHF